MTACVYGYLRLSGSYGRGSNLVGICLVRWLVRFPALPGDQRAGVMAEEQKTCTFFKKSGKKGGTGRKRRQQTPSDDEGTGIKSWFGRG